MTQHDPTRPVLNSGAKLSESKKHVPPVA